MRIGLDVRYVSHGLFGGVRNVVHALATVLPRIGRGHEFVYYADDKGPLELSDLPSNVQVRTLQWRHALSSIRNDAALGRLAEADRLDVFHAPANTGPLSRVPLVLLAQDGLNLFPLSEHLRGFSRHPRQVAMMMYLGHQMRRSLRGARHIISPSAYSAQDISRRSGVPLERFTAVHLAASDAFRPVPADELSQTTARLGLTGRYLLADGIKNPEAVVGAYRALPHADRRDLQLAFFSREPQPRPAVADALREFGDARIRFIPQPTDAALVHLMSGATVFLLPSFFEGFGVPLVEAMRCGTPIVASTRGSIPEVVGDGGLCADIDVPDAFAAQVRRLVTDESLRQMMATRSLARGRVFDWQTTAARVLSVLERHSLAGARQS